MKKIILPLAALILVSFTVSDTPLTKAERKMAVKELMKTQKHLLKTVKGLSEAQLNFKSSPDSWSVAECMEHIAISENMIFGQLEEALKTPADPSRRSEVKMSDEQLLSMIVDRSHKAKAPENFQPSGKYGSYEGALKEYKEKRAEHIKYVKNTDDDLRNHYLPSPIGTVDAFQVLLFMSAHNERHVKQMEEVMADKNFPKK